MPSTELRIGDRTAYFRKAITCPTFDTDRVLSTDPFNFVELWLRQNCIAALPFWSQARSYYRASRDLPPQASPLVLYYCFLNAVKALLKVKGTETVERHGVAGGFESARRELNNETIKIHASGVLSSLSRHLGESTSEQDYSLKSLLLHLPYIHRAFTYTFKSQNELFIPIQRVVYHKHPEEERVWVTFDIVGRYANHRTLSTLPNDFEIDRGFSKPIKVRTKKRVNWHSRGAPNTEVIEAKRRLSTYHQKVRRRVLYIASTPDLWYLKRNLSGTPEVDRSTLTITMAAMHRLSELARYDPGGLENYLSKKENFLLTEFIDRSPIQFLDEIACEITGLEFGVPGIRPR